MGAQGSEPMLSRVAHYPQLLKEKEVGPRSSSVISNMSSSSHKIYEVYDIPLFCLVFLTNSNLRRSIPRGIIV